MANISPLYTCLDFPIGNYTVDSFGTYKQRQSNPHVKNLKFVNITAVTLNYVAGTVLPINETKPYFFNATCKRDTFNLYHELRLLFQAPVKSLINNCSGIFNFNLPHNASLCALYLGAESLITGDTRSNPCQELGYGTLIPPVCPSS